MLRNGDRCCNGRWRRRRRRRRNRRRMVAKGWNRQEMAIIIMAIMMVKGKEGDRVVVGEYELCTLGSTGSTAGKIATEGG